MIGQGYFVGVSSTWDDRLDEWELEVEDEDAQSAVIYISQLWPLRNNWEEWRIEGELLEGNIKTKWRGDISQWELRTAKSVVLISQLSRGDLNRWELREGSQRVTVSTKYYDNPNEWVVKGSKDAWAMWTTNVNDPRDWYIEDYIDGEYSLALRTGLVFISLWQSIPKAN